MQWGIRERCEGAAWDVLKERSSTPLHPLRSGLVQQNGGAIDDPYCPATADDSLKHVSLSPKVLIYFSPLSFHIINFSQSTLAPRVPLFVLQYACVHV